MALHVNRQVVISCGLLFSFLAASTFTGDWSPWIGSCFGVLVGALLFFCRQSLGLDLHWRSPWLWLLILLVAFAATIPWSGDRYSSVRMWVYWFIGAGFFVAARGVDRSYRTKLLVAIVIVAGAAGLFAIGQFIRNNGVDRAVGFFQNANALGSYAILFLPLGLALTTTVRGWLQWLVGAATASLAISLVLSYSVTAGVALLFASIIATALKVVKLRWYRVWKAVVAISCILFLGVGVRYVQTRDVSNAIRLDRVISGVHFQSSFSQRQEFIGAAVAMFRERPLTGVGLGAYQLASSRFLTSRLEQPRYTHNAYVEVMAETGIIGFLALVGLFTALTFAVIRALRRVDAEHVIVVGVVFGLLASAIHALVDFGWHFPGVWVGFWILAGLVVGTGQRSRSVWSGKVIRTTLLALAFLVILRGLGVVASITHFQRADSANENGEFERAIPYYRAGLRWDPDPVRMTKLANALWVVKTPASPTLAEAERIARQSLQWSADAYATHLVLARIAVAKKDIEGAKNIYVKMVALDRHFHPEATAESINFLRGHGYVTEAERLTAEAEGAYQGILEPGQSLFNKSPVSK